MAREAISTWRPSRLRLGINRSGDFGLVAAESPFTAILWRVLPVPAGATPCSMMAWRPVWFRGGQ